MKQEKRTFLSKIDKAVLKQGIISGVLFALAIYIGHEVWTTTGIDRLFATSGVFFMHMFRLLILTLLLCVVSVMVLHYISVLHIPVSEKYDGILSQKRTWIFFWLIMIALHLLCYAAYYPGIFAYDIQTQFIQAGGWAPYSNHQPIFHTLLWKAFYMLELKCKREGLGIILFSLTQICVMSTVFVYVVYFMARRKINHWILLLTYLFYAVTPTLAVFTLIPTKDVPFSGTLIIFTLCLIELCENGNVYFEKKFSVGVLIISGVLCCLLRNNGIYVIFLIGVLTCISYPKRGVPCFATIIVSYYMILNIILNSMNVVQGPIHEVLSVPIAQLSNVYVNQNEELSEADKQLILTYIPAAENYNPCFADVVKDNFNDERFDENKGEFISLWWKFFLKEPVCYVNAFLSLNINYWYPGAVYPDPYSKREYIETRRWEGEHGATEVFFPNLYKFYENFAHYENPMMKWPIFSFFFSICSAAVLWVILLFCVYAKKRKDLVLPFCTAGFLLLTYMAGPTSLYRYVYTVLLLLPIYWALALQPEVIRHTREG